jgi:hypothetical protein
MSDLQEKHKRQRGQLLRRLHKDRLWQCAIEARERLEEGLLTEAQLQRRREIALDNFDREDGSVES